MAPDINTLPPSPRPTRPPTTSPPASPSRSRSATSAMAPPPVPHAASMPNSPSQSNFHSTTDNTGVGLGPGPIRHPRPLTAAELHLELEKEQEAVVNRLTRELSLLRQQTASVASTTSSTSANEYSGIVPTTARRHRSSSNLSTRSITATTGATSVSGVAPARETSVPNSARPSMDITRPSLSRENSTAAIRRSVTPSPNLSSALHGPGFSANHENRHTVYDPSTRPTPPQPSRQSSTSQIVDHTMHQRSPSFSSAIAQARYEEAAFHRAELESVKKENEILKRRIRDLERSLNQQASESKPE